MAEFNNVIDFDLLKRYDKLLKKDIALWCRETAYHVGDIVTCKGHYLKCASAGNSGTSAIDFTGKNVGDSITDGTVVWAVYQPQRILDYWAASTLYQANDLIIYENVIYKCITGHTSTSTFDSAKFEEVSGYNLPTASDTTKGGIKVGEGLAISEGVLSARDQLPLWDEGVDFEVGDKCIYSNTLYRCKTAHTSTNTFDETKFDVIGDGNDNVMIPVWTASTQYALNTVVLYNNDLYACSTAHTSTSTFDESKWTILTADVESIPMWTANTYYMGNQLVATGTNIYRCITAHTSGNVIDYSKFQNMVSLRDWVQDEPYTANEILCHNNILYKVTTNFVAGETFSETNLTPLKVKISADDDNAISQKADGLYVKKTPVIKGFQLGHSYEVGELLYNDVGLFKCNTAFTSSDPFNSTEYDNFDLMFADIRVYDSNAYYHIGSIVIHDNKLYRRKTVGNEAVFSSANWDYIGETYSVGIKNWETSTAYVVNELVVKDGIIYKCNANHTSDAFDTDTANWSLLYSDIKVWESNVYYKVGTTVIDSTNVLYRCTTAHTSGLELDNTKFTEVGVNTSAVAGNIIEKNIDGLYASDPVGMTQSEITDMINGFEAGGPNTKDIYSETEQRIGTWIDGKPLYQITIVGTSPSAVNTAGTVGNISSTWVVREFNGYLMQANNSFGVPVNSYWGDGTTYVVVVANYNENVLTMKVGNSVYTSRPVYVTIKYTKSTD